jgi:hypothetical protein
MKQWILPLLITCLWSVSIQAQEFPSQVWHDGKLVTIDGDSLYGILKYDLEGDVVQVKNSSAGTIKTFSARKISYFEIFDALQGYYRYFYSLPFFVRSNYKVTMLFELLKEGEITLLSREAIVMETVPQYNAYYRSNFTRQRLAYTYYFLQNGKELFEFGGKRNELLSIMSKHESEIKDYIKKYKLKTDERQDLVRIVTYFNELENS